MSPLRKGGEMNILRKGGENNEIGMNAQLVQDRLLIAPAAHGLRGVRPEGHDQALLPDSIDESSIETS